MSGFDPQTLAFYASEAPVYTASGKNGVSRHLDGFLEQLPSRSHILELGCGGGTDAAHMIAAGHSVDPTDGVSEVAAKAEQALGMPVRVMRFDQLDAVASYDAVVANASLLHVPRTELTVVLARIHDALRPGGWHMASYKGGGAEGRDRFGRYFNYLSAGQARDCYLAAAPWAQIDIAESMGGGYDGAQGPWIRVIARKDI